MRHLIRRTIRAALGTGQALTDAACRYTFRLLADLYRAADHGGVVVIGYRKGSGEASTRAVRPLDLRVTDAGDLTVRAYDHLRGEDRTFRIDRIVNYRAA